MKMYFKNRPAMRTFAKNTGKKAVDCGSDSPKGRRWSVKVS